MISCDACADRVARTGVLAEEPDDVADGGVFRSATSLLTSLLAISALLLFCAPVTIGTRRVAPRRTLLVGEMLLAWPMASTVTLYWFAIDVKVSPRPTLCETKVTCG